MKFIFSILTCRSKTEGIGALMGIISTSLSTSQDRHLNIYIVDTSWKTDICIMGVRFNVSVSVHVHLCVNTCVFAYIYTFISALMKYKSAFLMAIIFEPEGWVLKQAMMD